MKVGILGSVTVGRTPAGGFLKDGHEVMFATRDPARREDRAGERRRGAAR